MSKFTVNSHSLMALHNAVLGIAVELDKLPDLPLSVMNGMYDGGNGIADVYGAWYRSLAVSGKSIENLADRLHEAAISYATTELETEIVARESAGTGHH